MSRVPKRALLFLAAVCGCWAPAAILPSLTPDERALDAAWLRSVGIDPPAGGWPLEEPFAEPWTRRSLIVPTAWYRSRPPSVVRADSFREDLQLLRKVLQNTYGGWHSAQRRGWDWGAFFSDWDAELVPYGQAEVPLVKAIAPWRKLMAFQPDNHSGPEAGVFEEAGNSISWSAVLAKAPAAVCTERRTVGGDVYPIDPRDPAQQPKTREDAEGRPLSYLVAPHLHGRTVAVHCGSEWIPAAPAWFPTQPERLANVAALSGNAADVPGFRKISPRIAYLRLPTFTKQNVEKIIALEGVVTPAGESLLIVDLRGNGGGDARLRAVGKWVNLPRIDLKTRMSASCLAAPLNWGYMQNSSKDLTPPIGDWTRGALREWFDATLKPGPAGCPPKFDEHAGNWNYLKRRYPSKTKARTRVLLLVDNLCGSDCEMAVQTIAAIPGTVVAGVNTWGVAQFVRPGYMVLPNTRVVFHLALGQVDHYGDARSFDGYGFDVDILLPAQQDMKPESVLKLATRLLPI